MSYRFFCFCLLSAISQSIFPQDTTRPLPAKKLSFYATWGYSRWAFTKSDIRFTNTGDGSADPAHSSYDFTVYDAVAHDRPDFDQIVSNIGNFTIPQYNFRIGFYFNNRKDEGWELSYDHAKYIVDDGQKMRVKGTIRGEIIDKDSVMQYPYFHFEHSDGANFWQINYVRRWKLLASKTGRASLGWMLKPGGGVVIPRTDVTLFGTRLNNCFHIAGFVAGVETGLRAETGHLCLEFTTRMAYAMYNWSLVQYKGNGNASHRFGTIGAILSLGYQFRAGRKS